MVSRNEKTNCINTFPFINIKNVQGDKNRELVLINGFLFIFMMKKAKFRLLTYCKKQFYFSREPTVQGRIVLLSGGHEF